MPAADSPGGAGGGDAEAEKAKAKGKKRRIDQVDTDAPDGPDTMRRAVERHVARFVDDVFASARHGVEINGLRGVDAVSWDDEAAHPAGGDGGDGAGKEERAAAARYPADAYEAYDTRLATRITTLHARIEALNLQLANVRREGVRAAAEGFKAGYAEECRKLEGDVAALRERGGKEGDERGGASVAQYAFEGREGEVGSRFEDAVKGLERLRRDVDGVRGRGEEGLRVVQFFRGKAGDGEG